mgnify:CR=1 FL=1
MDDSMVTARMLDEKKRKGARILAREGLSASQAINLMYDKMIEEGEAGFLRADSSRIGDEAKWAAACSLRRFSILEARFSFRRYD